MDYTPTDYIIPLQKNVIFMTFRLPMQIKLDSENSLKWENYGKDSVERKHIIAKATELINGLISGKEVKTLVEALQELNSSSVFVGKGFKPTKNGIYINNPDSNEFQYCLFSTKSVKEHSLKRNDITSENYIFGIFSRIKRKDILRLKVFLQESSEMLKTLGFTLIELTLGALDLSRLGRSLLSLSAIPEWIQFSKDIKLVLRFPQYPNSTALFGMLLGATTLTTQRINQLLKKFNSPPKEKSDSGKIYTESEKAKRQITKKKASVSDLLNNQNDYFPMITQKEMEELFDKNIPTWKEYINNGYIPLI